MTGSLNRGLPVLDLPEVAILGADQMERGLWGYAFNRNFLTHYACVEFNWVLPVTKKNPNSGNCWVLWIDTFSNMPL